MREVFQKVVVGMDELNEAIEAEIDQIRIARKEKVGPGFNQEKNEMDHPIRVDYDQFEFSGVQIVDELTYTIALKQDFPQLVYWMSMTFFSPMPWEAVRFYQQHAAAERNFTLQRHPVGTGPYVLTENRPNYRVVLDRNLNFREELYPAEGAPGDEEKGLLEAAGKKKCLLSIEWYSSWI